MNILVTYNWIKEYLDTDLSPDEFAKELSFRSMSVEKIDYLRENYKNMVIGDVLELKEHPNADKLKIAAVDIGEKKVEIVCGGKNLLVDMKVLVALPGAEVRWHGEGDLVELKETKIRGVDSFGMICAPSEVGFEKAYCPQGGIWDLGQLTSATAGTSFVDALDIDDTVFDIEVTSNRVDSMSIVGLAREGGAVTEGEFKFNPPQLPKGGSGKDLSVTVKDGELCPRYMAVVIDGIKVGPSPAWLQKKLLLVGHRPINNIVDITNYILHEYGQPLHAFDYEKLTGGNIVVRRAKDGEKILALDEKEYELSADNLVIANSSEPVAVAGVMGGQLSGTNNETTTIVFESATFDPVSVRRTSRKLNLYSDSQLLFEKGLSVQLTELALARAVELTLEIAGGRVASEVVDISVQEYKPLVFSFRPEKARKLLGVDIETSQMKKYLIDLGFELMGDGEKYEVTVPFWRDHDIEDEVDFTEEIARIYGYHNIQGVLPENAQPDLVIDEFFKWENKTKHLLSASGYTEFYGYSFISKKDFERYDLSVKDAVEIYNPLSSDLTHMRTSLMPSLLKDIERNQGEVSKGKVFELARVYIPRVDDLPEEHTWLTIAHFGMENVENAFLEIKGVLDLLGEKTGIDFTMEREENNKYWHQTRSAKLMVGGENVGYLGQVEENYQNAFGINKPVVVAEVDFEKLVTMMQEALRYEEIPEYPAMVRDVAFALEERIEFKKVQKSILVIDNIVEKVELKDVYRGEGLLKDEKSITLSITLRSKEKTLSSNDADEIIEKVEKKLKEEFNAIMR